MERPRALLPFWLLSGHSSGSQFSLTRINFNVSTRLRLPSVYVLQGSGPSVHLVLMVAASLGIFGISLQHLCCLSYMHSRRMRGVFHLGVIIEATYIQDQHGCAHERAPCHMVHLSRIPIYLQSAYSENLRMCVSTCLVSAFE